MIAASGKIARFNMFKTKFQDKDNEIRRRRKIVNYLEVINAPRYIIFMSIKDDGRKALTKEIMEKLGNLGLKTDLLGKDGNSYYAIIAKNEIIEDGSDGKLELSGIVSGTDVQYLILSEGYDGGNLSSIVIEGKEYSIHSKGLNIVVYNSETKQVVDTVCFDTYEGLVLDRLSNP